MKRDYFGKLLFLSKTPSVIFFFPLHPNPNQQSVAKVFKMTAMPPSSIFCAKLLITSLERFKSFVGCVTISSFVNISVLSYKLSFQASCPSVEKTQEYLILLILLAILFPHLVRSSSRNHRDVHSRQVFISAAVSGNRVINSFLCYFDNSSLRSPTSNQNLMSDYIFCTSPRTLKLKQI